MLQSLIDALQHYSVSAVCFFCFFQINGIKVEKSKMFLVFWVVLQLLFSELYLLVVVGLSFQFCCLPVIDASSCSVVLPLS